MFARRFSPISSIQAGARIEFEVKIADHLYFDLKIALLAVK